MHPPISAPAIRVATIKRVAYGGVAVAAATIGCVGIVVPGLPTTPFVLVALWAAARSSDRLSRWMHRVRPLRAAVEVAEDYATHRSLPLHLKVLSQVMAYGAVGVGYVVTHSVLVVGVVFGAAVASTVFMVLTPTRD